MTRIQPTVSWTVYEMALDMLEFIDSRLFASGVPWNVAR